MYVQQHYVPLGGVIVVYTKVSQALQGLIKLQTVQCHLPTHGYL